MNTISGNPLFLDKGRNDFHIAKNSPCIDAGTSEGATNSDIDGESRPKGSGYDIGADEYSDGEAIDVRGAILVLRYLVNRQDDFSYFSYRTSGLDVSGNSKIGLEDAIFILQGISGLRELSGASH